MKIEIKVRPDVYARLADGTRNFHLSEPGVQAGDDVEFKEWDPSPKVPGEKTPIGFTGSPALAFRVGYVHVLDSSQVVFALLAPTKKIKS